MKELKMLRAIKSVTFSTSWRNEPFSRIVDVMLVETGKLFFVTARGKDFYHQLMKNPVVAITGMDENYTMIRLKGEAKLLPAEQMDDYRTRIFQENPGLGAIYNQEQRDILDVFCIDSGHGDVFDLGSQPPTRTQVSFGVELPVPWGYVIQEACIGCGQCVPLCPTGAIQPGTPYIIDGSLCLECGKCNEICPVDAITHAKNAK